MKIFQLSHGVYPYTNAGVEIYTYELSRALMKRGHELLVSAPVSEEKLKSKMADIPISPVYYEHTMSLESQILSQIDSFDPDIIHIQHLIHLRKEAFSLLDKIRRPFVLSLHDYWYICEKVKRRCGGHAFLCAHKCFQRSFRHPRFFLEKWLEIRERQKKTIRLLNQIPAPLIAVSPRALKVYEQAGLASSKGFVHPCGIDLQKIPSETPVAPRSKMQFGFLGTLLPEKGPQILLEAFQQMKQSADLHFYGSGNPDFVSQLKKTPHRGNVFFHGEYDHEELSGILPRLDVLVMPSLWEETYGLVVQEALAAQKVVIVSAIGGMKDRIIPGENGFLFNPGNVRELTEKMDMVVKDYPKLKSQLHFDLCRQDIQSDAQDFEKIYERTIANWPAPTKK